MSKTLSIWLHSIGAAFLSGGAGAIVAIFATPNFDLFRDYLIVTKAFLTLGILGVALVLKQSPLPPQNS